MSGSEPTARVALASANTMLEITIVGPDFRPVASGVGALETDVPPGIYQIVTRAGPSVERQLISLAAGETHTARDLWVSFPSSAPVAGTTTTHEYHQELASEVTRRAQQDTTARSWLAVIVRDVRGRDGPPLDVATISRLAILDRSMQPVLGGADGWELRDRDAAAAWSAGLPPGGYLLRSEGTSDGPIDQAIWLMPGWQTIVFLSVGPSGPDPASTSIHMVDLNLAWSPYEDRAAEAAELASWALREGRSVVPHDLLDLLLNRKFRNPMFGLIGAHALLVAPSVDEEELATVLMNLDTLIAGHPDLVALRWIAEERRAQAAGEAPVVPPDVGGMDWPPMLLASYQALLRMDAEDPGALRDGSVAERVAGTLVVEGIWTAWRPVPPDVEEPPADAISPPPPVPMAADERRVESRPRSIGLPKLPWRGRAGGAPSAAVPGRGAGGAEWQPELETGEVLAGLSPSIGALARRPYRDPATARVARYLANVAELEGPQWAGARFGEITTAELARATQLPSATVDRSVRELRLLATTLPAQSRPAGDDRKKDNGRRFRLPTAFLTVLGLVGLVGVGAVVGRAVLVTTPTAEPTPSATAEPTPSATSEPTAVVTPSPDVTASPPPTPLAIGFPRVDPLELYFGEVVIGFETFSIVTVANGGDGLLRVAPPTLSGPAAAEFATDGGCAGVELSPGGACAIGVTFRPLGFDVRPAELVIETAGHEPVVVPMAGIGLEEGALIIDPLEWDFAFLSPINVTVVATGPVIITGVAIEGEFAGSYAVDGAPCVVVLAAEGIGCVVTVGFIGEFVSCDTFQPAELVFTTFGGIRYPVFLQTSVIC